MFIALHTEIKWSVLYVWHKRFGGMVVGGLVCAQTTKHPPQACSNCSSISHNDGVGYISGD